MVISFDIDSDLYANLCDFSSQLGFSSPQDFLSFFGNHIASDFYSPEHLQYLPLLVSSYRVALGR